MSRSLRPDSALRLYLLQLPLWSLLIVLILVALSALTLRSLLPQIDELRPDIQNWLNQHLPYRIESQSLQASLYQLDPQIEVQGLSLSREGREFLRVQSLNAELDTLSSLLAWAPRMQRAQLEGLDLWLKETPNGWVLPGWETLVSAGNQNSGREAEEELSQLLDWVELLLVQGQLDFSDLTLHLTPLEGPGLELQAPHLNYRRWSGGRQLDFVLGVTDQTSRSRLVITLEGENFDPRESRLQAWLQLQELEANGLNSFLPPAWRQHLTSTQGQLSLDAWLELEKGRCRLEVRGKPLELSLDGNDLQTGAWAGSFSGDADSWSGQWQLQGLQWKSAQLSPLAGEVSFTPERWSLAIEQMELQEAQAVMAAIPRLPQTLKETLASLQPRGQLRQLFWEQGNEQGWQLTSLLQAVAVEAWQGAPAVEGLNAWLEANAQGGQVVFSQRDLQIGFTDLYSQPFYLDAAQGRVAWSHQPENIWVEGRDLQASLPLPETTASSTLTPTRVSGDFRLALLPGKPDRFYLNLGLLPTQVAAHQQLVPDRVLDAEVNRWLKAALSQGLVEKGGFVYSGDLSQAGGHFQLHLDFKDTQLAFAPDWPLLQEAEGWVRIEPDQLQGEVSAARYLDAQLSRAHFTADLMGDQQQLHLASDLTTPLDVFPQLISLSPLGEVIPEVLHTWQYQGQGQGHLQLTLPLDSLEVDQLDLNLAIDQGQLYIDQAQLPLDDLQGQLLFSLEQGLAGSRMTASLWDQPLEARIDGEENRLLVTGQQQAADWIQWLEWPALPWMRGQAEVELALQLNPLTPLVVSSDLQGVLLDLPAPFGKEISASWPLAVKLDLEEDEGLPLSLQLDDRLHLVTRVEQPDKGIGVHLANQAVQPAQLPGERKLHLRADLHWLDLETGWVWWQQQLKELAGSERFSSADQDETFDFPMDQQLELHLGEVFWGETSWGPVYANLILEKDTGLQSSWVSNPLIGQIDWAGPQAPLAIDLQRLKWPLQEAEASLAEEEETSSENPDPRQEALLQPLIDPLADLDPRFWPASRWSIESVEIGQRYLGRMQGETRADDQQWQLLLTQGDSLQTRFSGQLNWQLEPANRTQVELKLEGRNPAPALAAMTLAPSPVVAEDHQLQASVHWPASPAAFSLARAQGQVDLSLASGYFPETQGAPLGASRVFGLMNLDNLVRRLSLDFSDVTSDGVSFDRVDAHYSLEDGYLRTREPTVMQSSAARVTLEGELDLLRETQDQELRVTLPFGQTLPLAAVVLGAPQVGAAIWLAQKFVGLFVDTSREALYEIKGPLKDPEVNLKRLL
ncbi:YhdP family protein [Marinospirillum perlucidum]|uniref:YhdP family phospholipid transporter n=1 Tax=Marinospirillum perlucidum TaxID=1982602 RepID=UPI000DF2E9DD|nr:AsmA-like C-terminal region-containing protein [Marinospirillum perlucidum]